MQGKQIPIKQMHFVRVDPGEELVHAITQYAEDQHIQTGFVSFIGAMRNMKIIVPGNADKVQPVVRDFFTKSEIIGNGTITMKDGKPFAHLHFMRANDQYQVTGGHLVSGEVIIVVEVVIIEGEGEIQRALDPKTLLHKMVLD